MTGTLCERQTPIASIAPLLFTVRQAAQALSVCEKTLSNLTKRGAIRPVRIGRGVRYDVEELKGFIERQKVGLGTG